MSSDEVVRRDESVPSETKAEAAPVEAAASPVIESTAPAAEPAREGEAADRPRPRLNPSGPSDAAAIPSLGGAAEASTEVAVAESPAPRPTIAPPPPPSGPVAVPPRSELDAEIEAEIEAAMASGELGPMGSTAVPDVEMPAVDAALGAPPASRAPSGGAKPAPVKPPEEELIGGIRLSGKIVSVHGDDVLLDLGYRSTGVVQLKQFEQGKKPEEVKKPEAGQTIQVVVDKVDTAAGLILCNLPRALRKTSGNWESLSIGQIVDCMVSKTNKGGLEVTISSMRGFLPAGQVDVGYVGDLEPFVGQKLRVQVTEVNPKKRNLVVSRRAFLMIERKEAEETLWKTLSVGQKFSGRVKTIKDYGAFIDIGGVDGFLHIGEMSWTRIRHPSDVLKEGDSVDVAVVTLDAEKKKIGLGMRQLSANPWSTATSKYMVGSSVSGTVTRTADFGAFVELEPGLEGLIHISELDYKRVRKVDDVVKQGASVEAKVLEVDPERKRISLSLKALKEKPEEPKKPADEDLAPSANQPAFQPRRKSPLKGGTGGSGGGGLFGNPRDFH